MPEAQCEERERNPLYDIARTKQARKDLDTCLRYVKDGAFPSRETSICVMKIREAIMWLGMELKRIGTPDPYPESYNPESPVVEPTADGLKM